MLSHHCTNRAQLLTGVFNHHSLQLGDDLITTFLNNYVSSRGYESNMNWETGEGHPFEYFVFGAACSEVEIDCLTGAHKVSTSWKDLHVALLDTLRFHIQHLCEHRGSTIDSASG